MEHNVATEHMAAVVAEVPSQLSLLSLSKRQVKTVKIKHSSTCEGPQTGVEFI